MLWYLEKKNYQLCFDWLFKTDDTLLLQPSLNGEWMIIGPATTAVSFFFGSFSMTHTTTVNVSTTAFSDRIFTPSMTHKKSKVYIGQCIVIPTANIGSF